jgi:hypothetical protein
MAWVRIHDNAMDHPKLSGISDKAFRLWVWGLSYSQRHLTDGLIGERSVPPRLRRAMADLLRVGLWEPHDIGYRVHDYLQWNDSKEVVVKRMRLAAHRRAFMTDPELRRDLRARDGDACRYCGCQVDWRDRRGANGATYDHVDPRGPATLDNLVVACRGCNSKKRDRLPEIAGMRLLPEPGKNLDTGPRKLPGTKPNQTKPNHLPKEQEEIAPEARSKRPIFSGQRLTVYEWMLDDCVRILGNHLDSFDLHEWFFALDAELIAKGLVLPSRGNGPWLQQQLVAEAQRRNIPLAFVTADTPGDDDAWARVAAAGPSPRSYDAKR